MITQYFIYMCVYVCICVNGSCFEEQSMPHVFGLLLLSVQDDFILDVGL